MYGRLEERGARWTLQFTRTLPHPPEKVWRALIEPEQVAAWFPTTIDGDREAGAKLRFVFPFEDAPTMDGEMLIYDPPSVLEFRWGDDTLRFELRPEGGDATVLTLVDTFDELGKAARDAAGWHAKLDILGYHLSGEAMPFDPDARWGEVHPWYVEHLPREATTVGPPDWHP
jgi:uncharacterized protein YndB with AHSA1/START domain